MSLSYLLSIFEKVVCLCLRARGLSAAPASRDIKPPRLPPPHKLKCMGHMPKLSKCSKWVDHRGRKCYLRNRMRQLYPVVDHVYMFGFRRGCYKGPTRDDDMVLLAYGYTRGIETNDSIQKKNGALAVVCHGTGLECRTT